MAADLVGNYYQKNYANRGNNSFSTAFYQQTKPKKNVKQNPMFDVRDKNKKFIEQRIRKRVIDEKKYCRVDILKQF